MTTNYEKIIYQVYLDEFGILRLRFDIWAMLKQQESQEKTFTVEEIKQAINKVRYKWYSNIVPIDDLLAEFGKAVE